MVLPQGCTRERGRQNPDRPQVDSLLVKEELLRNLHFLPRRLDRNGDGLPLGFRMVGGRHLNLELA